MKVVALDSGTSAVKAILASPAPNRGWHIHARVSIPLAEPLTAVEVLGAVEQEADDLWRAAVDALRTLLRDESSPVAAICLTGQMQSVVLVDSAGKPLRPALLYSDCRAADEASELEALIGIERLQRETANWKGAASILPKLLWLSRHEPDFLRRAHALLPSAPSALLHRLTGASLTDPTNAGVTGMLSADTRDTCTEGTPTWAHALIADAGLAALLTPLLPAIASRAAAVPLSEAAAQLLGLDACVAGTPVCLSGDLGATTVGALGTGGSGTYLYAGTSGWVATTRHAVACPESAAFSTLHPEDASRRVLAAPMAAAGANVDWVRQLLWPDVPRDEGFARRRRIS